MILHPQSVRRLLAGLALYISVSGLVTFSMFILEESAQVATFATWPAAEAKDWGSAKLGCDRIRDANRLLRIINYSCGWIQPLAFIAYRSYALSTDVYIRAMRSKIFAHAPELFDGERISTTFIPLAKESAGSSFIYHNRNITYLSTEELQLKRPMPITASVTIAGPRIVLAPN